MTDISFNDKEKRQIHRQLPVLGKLVLPQTCSPILLISRIGNCFEIWTGREIKGGNYDFPGKCKTKNGHCIYFSSQVWIDRNNFISSMKTSKNNRSSCALQIFPFLCAGFTTKTTNAYFSKKFNLLEQTSYGNCFVRCLSCTITKALCTKAQYWQNI